MFALAQAKAFENLVHRVALSRTLGDRNVVRPTILLDEPILGIDVYLRDQGWNIKTVRETLGAGRSDDQIIVFAKTNKFVLVTPDRKLVRRCKLLNVEEVELGVEIFAEAVNRQLTKMYPVEE